MRSMIDSALESAIQTIGARPELEELGTILRSVRRLPEFLEAEADRVRLTTRQARTVVLRALQVFRDVYVHLPLKRALHAVDPVRRLELLGLHLERDGKVFKAAMAAHRDSRSKLAFHRELTDVFLSARDRHLLYVLPPPFLGHWAFLGFEIELAERRGTAKKRQTVPGRWPSNRTKYLVSRILLELEPHLPKGFEQGVEIVTWNGVPIERAVGLAAERAGGSNPAAQKARGLMRLTLRPLGWALPPDEDWVEVGFRKLDGKRAALRFPWYVAKVPKPVREQEENSLQASGGPVSYDPEGSSLRSLRRILFFEPPAGEPPPQQIADGGWLSWEEESELPHVFRAGWIRPTAGGPYRYLRIFTFQESSERFVRVFKELVLAGSGDPTGAERGLVLDLRDNSGGKIHAAERCLQLLSPRPIEPQRFQYRNTWRNRAVGPVFGRLWGTALVRAIETQAVYSQAHPLTPRRELERHRQIYHGPIVLIVSAESYSATEVFAAGFQDHSLGTIIGVDPRTGGGAADVWPFDKLLEALKRREPSLVPYKVELPAGIRMVIPFRRALRTGTHFGVTFEDHGVEVKEENHHRITAGDLLHRNVDLLSGAAKKLAEREAERLWIRLEPPTEDTPELFNAKIVTKLPDTVTEIEIYADESPRQTLDVPAGSSETSFQLSFEPPGTTHVGILELRAVQRAWGRRVLGVWRLERPWNKEPWVVSAASESKLGS